MTERNKAPVRIGAVRPEAAARPRRIAQWNWPLERWRTAASETLRDWLAVETAAGRLMPWLPIAFGLGIAIYFAAEREPALWAALGLVGVTAAAAWLARRRPVAFPLLLGAAAAAAGFAASTVKSARVAHPVLMHVASNVEIAGWVMMREERERSDRIVVHVHRIDGGRLDEAPDRVRVSVRKGAAPPVGSFVAFKARLNPPQPPLRPGGYDFARDLWFQGIGASGFVLGAVKFQDPPAPASAWLAYAALVQGVRDAIDRRIRAAVSGDAGSIASALITGKRDAISAPVNDAMYTSSLAHVLSISGYHMAIVAGVMFLVVRGLLALIPTFATRYPIKKWAAAAALAAAALYLALSGAEVATQRAFIMTAVVLGGVLVDRAALTLRTLAIAALVVLVIAPQSVVHPSFQMSFAATLALVAAYERGLPLMKAQVRSSLGARLALWGVSQAAGLIFASLVAGLATTLYAAYHFHRLAPYGVIANLIAMPIVSVLVMPAGLAALAVMPFGFDGFLWRLMGQGIEWMIAVATTVASLPGAVGRIGAFGTGPLLLGTAGLALLCLLRTRLRWSGVAVLVIAVVLAVRTPLPDVLATESAEAVGVRDAAGRLAIIRFGADAFAAREWLAAEADARAPGDASLREGTRCDEVGCVARTADGAAIALARSAEAFADDCVKAAVIVTRHNPPSGCSAMVLQRAELAQTGAVALRRVNGAWERTDARPPGYQRPWAKVRGAASVSTSQAPTARPASRDATPRPEDLEADD